LAGDVELLIFDASVRERAVASTVIDITAGWPRIVRTGETEKAAILEMWEKEIRSA
jgi:tRNA A37 threonylcarbamoyladenosine synthetase subunit TsaC/SUA5/YrdC